MDCLGESMSLDPSKHRQELLERLDILRNNDIFCDVTIAVKDKEFKAHRAVLAATSPFFLTLLTSEMKEGNEKLIKVELEEATESVMEDALEYLYTGNVTVVEGRAHNLIATANFLLLPSLKTMAANVLKDTLTTENCVFNYYFAEKYDCVELKDKCREVINTNFSVVMETEDFLKLDQKQVMEWVSSDDVIVNEEEDIFKGIVRWVSHNKSEREGDFPELLHQVRLPFLSRDFLLDELVKDELITKNPVFCSNFVINAMKVVLSASDSPQQPRKCQETHIDGIFICGGKRALCYFPQKDMWCCLADSPFQDYEGHSLVEYKSNVYVADGETRRLGESHVFEFYSPLKNSWGTAQRNDDITDFTCLTVLKGDMYAMCFANFPKKGRICRYDSEKNCWQEMDAPPCLQDRACVVADEQFLYIIGGTLDWGVSAVRTTNRFDPINNKLEELADINRARYNATFGAAMNGKIYIAGGFSSSNYKGLTSCEVYNPPTNEWQLMPSLKVPRYNASMVCFAGQLYVLGGTRITQRGASMRALGVEMFDSERYQWTEKSAIPVGRFESEDEKKQNKAFQACVARICKRVINKLEPLNPRPK
ncbi:unnamed protein product [Porites evermanni]|uniref:BTB domain-containing protein n=1 Tax=Porites evermanni TaxID=104178 RepID=A0ABN8RJX3_9CNID|nr:unnamed protein product [Porites evermanni]